MFSNVRCTEPPNNERFSCESTLVNVSINELRISHGSLKHGNQCNCECNDQKRHSIGSSPFGNRLLSSQRRIHHSYFVEGNYVLENDDADLICLSCRKRLVGIQREVGVMGGRSTSWIHLRCPMRPQGQVCPFFSKEHNGRIYPFVWQNPRFKVEQKSKQEKKAELTPQGKPGKIEKRAKTKQGDGPKTRGAGKVVVGDPSHVVYESFANFNVSTIDRLKTKIWKDAKCLKKFEEGCHFIDESQKECVAFWWQTVTDEDPQPPSSKQCGKEECEENCRQWPWIEGACEMGDAGKSLIIDRDRSWLDAIQPKQLTAQYDYCLQHKVQFSP